MLAGSPMPAIHQNKPLWTANFTVSKSFYIKPKSTMLPLFFKRKKDLYWNIFMLSEIIFTELFILNPNEKFFL